MNIKELTIGIALLVLLGVAGFLYRNAVTRPVAPIQSVGTACTLEAKVCPDGTSVGRTGPDCAFAPCPLPNVDMPDEGIAFAIPAGFAADENAIGAEPTLRAAFVAPGDPHGGMETLIIRDYPIPTGKTAMDTMLTNTVYGASGNTATDRKELKLVVIGGKTFYFVVIERFEGQVHTAYYLPRTSDVLRFEAIDTGVANWTDSNLDIQTLAGSKDIQALLETLQVSKQ